MMQINEPSMEKLKMQCIEKECSYREFNGGDDIGDFYFCSKCGISVKRGECECLDDKFESEVEK